MPTPIRRPIARAAAPAAAPTTSGYRGAEGLAMARREEAEQSARREAAQQNASMPFRFFCSPGEEEPRQIVVVDYTLDEVFFRFEHNMKDKRTQKWTTFCACIRESANCPVCAVAERQSYFAMYLTIIDLTPYEGKHGVVEWSKKLLVIKTTQQKKFTRLFERHGTFRGMILDMSRDSDKDAAIGNEIEFVDFMSEEELLTFEMEYEYEQQGKKKVKLVKGHEPFNYEELFPAPTEQQLRAIVGGRPAPGTRDDDDAAIGRTTRRPPARADEFDQPPAGARPQVRRAPARQEIHPDDMPDAGADPEPVARRAATRPTVQPAARPVARPPARRAAPPEEELPPDDGTYEEEEAAPPPRRAAPPQRPAGRAAAPPAAPQRPVARRPAPDPEPEPEQEEGYYEEPPATAAESLAARRRQLRR